MSNPLGLTDEQYDILKTICATVQKRKLPARVSIIVTETALVESDLQIFANSNVPESFNYFHTNVGSDHDSVGILQQRAPGWGWGSVAECMNVAHATGAFVDVLLVHPWESQPNGVSAQQVQVSAFPDRYQEQDAMASQLVYTFRLMVISPPKEKVDVKFDIWQIVHNPGRGRQYAVQPGSVPVWMSPSIKATLAFFGWFNSPIPRGCEKVQIDQLTSFAKQAR